MSWNPFQSRNKKEKKIKAYHWNCCWMWLMIFFTWFVVGNLIVMLSVQEFKQEMLSSITFWVVEVILLSLDVWFIVMFAIRVKKYKEQKVGLTSFNSKKTKETKEKSFYEK